MEDYSLIPTWEQVAAMYKYAPGRGGLSDEEWAEFRKHTQQTRKELRENKRSRAEFEKAAKANDRLWQKAEKEDSRMFKTGSELPDSNLNKYAQRVAQDLQNSGPLVTLADAIPAGVEYINNAVARPQNAGELAVALAHDTGESVGNWLAGLFGLGNQNQKEEAEFDAWLDDYIQEAGTGSSGAGLDANSALAGTPFPELAGYNPDWESITKAMAELKAPEYKTAEYDPLSAIAVGLSNVDWNSGIVPDFSGAVNKMVAMEEGYKKDKAEAENKTSEAKYQTARQNLANHLALESIREKSAARNAEIALARWNAMQPKALGGNKMSWRDSAGNLHFEAIDKHGEARTLGSNEGMADILALGEKGLKNLTPQRLAKMAEKRALLIGDKASQIPYRQGYILQANEMLNAFNRKE